MLFKFATADIETRDKEGNKSWTEFYMIGLYDGVSYKKFYILDHFLDEILEKYAGVPVYLHFLDFDGMFLLDHLLKRKGVRVKPVLAGSLLLSMSLEYKGLKYEFRNSFSVLPKSLGALCEAFDEHPKVSLNKLEERNYWDCVTLYNIIQKENNWLDGFLSKTMALTALKIWRSKHLTKKICNNRWLDKLAHKAYHGGLNELYHFNTDPDKNIYIYDINSMYPSAMLENKFPVGELKRSYSHDPEAVGFCLVTTFEYDKIPCLPEFLGKTLYLSGKKRVWITTPEYEYLQERGIYTRFELGYETTNSDYIFKSYVEEFYRRKSEAKANNDMVSYTISKLLLNSLYGKFGQKPEIREYGVNPGEDFFNEKTIPITADGAICYNMTSNRRPFMNPTITALVTGLARVKISRYAHSVDPEILYYIDTDSCFLSEKKLENSDALGRMALEKECRPFYPIAPKFYIAGTKISMKGIPTPSLDIEDKKEKKRMEYEILRKNFLELLQGKELTFDRGISKFRTAIKKDPNNLIQLKRITKSIKTPFDKREILPDLSTNSWEKEKMNPEKNILLWNGIKKDVTLMLKEGF